MQGATYKKTVWNTYQFFQHPSFLKIVNSLEVFFRSIQIWICAKPFQKHHNYLLDEISRSSFFLLYQNCTIQITGCLVTGNHVRRIFSSCMRTLTLYASCIPLFLTLWLCDSPIALSISLLRFILLFFSMLVCPSSSLNAIAFIIASPIWSFSAILSCTRFSLASFVLLGFDPLSHCSI